MSRKLSWLFTILAISLLVSCSDGGSSNSDSRNNSNNSNNNNIESSSTQNKSCSDEFGDASRCETRDNL